MPFKFKDKPKEPHLETMIDGHGQFYRIDFYNNKTQLSFYDSSKKYKMELEDVAKIFKIPGKSKLLLGYRPVGREVTDWEWERVIGDTRILAVAMRWQKAQGLTGLTIASDALRAYKNMIGRGEFRRRHPKLDLSLDAVLRPAYRGGWTYLNPVYKEEYLENIYVFDINSMYPACMAGMHDEKLPYGLCRRVDEDYQLQDDEIDIIKIYSKPSLKDGCFPWIHYCNVNGHTNEEFIIDCEMPIELTLTRPDYDLFLETYNDDDYGGVLDRYVFKCEIGMFSEYVEYWNKVKEESAARHDMGMRQLAKDMMNNLSGRFALNPDRESKVPIFNEEKNKVTYEPVDSPTSPLYVPTSAFITGHSRSRIIRDAMKFKDKFVYADTDSLHILGEGIDFNKYIEIDKYKLGYYKNEEIWNEGKYLRSKAYIHKGRNIETDKDDKEVKCGGLPKKAKEFVDFDNFYIGSEIEGKLMGRVVPGGYLLRETTFKINEKEFWGLK